MYCAPTGRRQRKMPETCSDETSRAGPGGGGSVAPGRKARNPRCHDSGGAATMGHGTSRAGDVARMGSAARAGGRSIGRGYVRVWASSKGGAREKAGAGFSLGVRSAQQTRHAVAKKAGKHTHAHVHAHKTRMRATESESESEQGSGSEALGWTERRWEWSSGEVGRTAGDLVWQQAAGRVGSARVLCGRAQEQEKNSERRKTELSCSERGRYQLSLTRGGDQRPTGKRPRRAYSSSGVEAGGESSFGQQAHASAQASLKALAAPTPADRTDPPAESQKPKAQAQGQAQGPPTPRPPEKAQQKPPER